MDRNQAVFKEQLKKVGCKLTSQRKAILDVMIQNEGEHLSCEEIYEQVRKTYPDIGLATVYRTLILFEKMELVYKLDLDDGCSRYELNINTDDHLHHHLICVKCGEVTEVKDDLLDILEEQISKENGFHIKDHKVKFYGYCKRCWNS